MRRIRWVALALLSFLVTLLGASIGNLNLDNAALSAVAAYPPTMNQQPLSAPLLIAQSNSCGSPTISKPTKGIDTNGAVFHVFYDFTRGIERVNPAACGREYWIPLEKNNPNYGLLFVYLIDGQKNRVSATLYVETTNGDLLVWNGNPSNSQLRRTQSQKDGTQVVIQGNQSIVLGTNTQRGVRQTATTNQIPNANNTLQPQTNSSSSPIDLTQSQNIVPSSLTTSQTLVNLGVVGSGTAASCTEAALDTALASGANITFNCGTTGLTIKLTKERVIARNTVIDGGNLITLSGGGKNRLFYTQSQVELTLKNLTIADGFTTDLGGGIFSGYQGKLTVSNCNFKNNISTKTGSFDGGGAIYSKSESTVTIDKSTFSGNKAANGGAINTVLSDLTIANSTFTNNQSVGSGTGGGGGAIFNDGAKGDRGIIKVSRSTFTNNAAVMQGGAIFTQLYNSNTMNVDQSTFSGNRVTGTGNQGFGGGIFHISDKKLKSLFTVTNTTFASNTASNQGGGLWTGNSAPVNISNSTFSGNQAKSADGTNGLGGGIMRTSGKMNLTNVTIANNYAGFQGGGIVGNTDVTLKNVIIANNKANNGGKGWNIRNNCFDTMTNGGNNLQYPAKNQSDANDRDCTASIKTADPKLGTLANNGGLTQTLPLLTGSAAINTGNNTTCPVTDQRGIKRPQQVTCDIGAYEVN